MHPPEFGPFVGRERELRALLDGLARAAQEHGGLVLVTGEPGIGKTRLVAEVAERARSDGWQTLGGRAYESEGMPPYLPFTEALREYVREAALDDLRAQLGDGAAEVAILVGDVHGRLPGLPASPMLSAESERYRLFESVSDFLLNVAHAPGHRGLLLILDDLHWADPSSLLLLRHLARRAPTGRILVVGTFRSIGSSPDQPLADLLADLSREHLATHVTLGPLSRDAVAAFLTGFTGRAVAASLARALHEETEGNPFFVEEIVRDLQADGRDLALLDTIPSEMGVPESVRHVIGRRLARLSASANRMLQVAAALGDGFTFREIAAVRGADDPNLLDTLDAVLAAGVLRENGDRYDFTHALIRQTIDLGLNAPRRALIHCQIGEALEHIYAANVDSHLSEIAHHYVEASIAGDPSKAINYAERAGDRALSILAYEDAARLYKRALDLNGVREPPDFEQRGRLLLALGDAQRKAGHYGRAMDALGSAVELGRERGMVDLLARAAVGFEDAMLPTGLPRPSLDHPSIRYQEEALNALGDADSVPRSRVLAGLARAVHFAGALERAERLGEEAVAVARRLGDSAALAYALQARRFTIWGPDGLDERLAVAMELIRLAEEVGDPEVALEGSQWRIRGLFESGDVPEADREILRYARLAEQVRQPRYLSMVGTWHAIRAILDGRFAEAERYAEHARAIGDQVQSKNAQMHYVAQMLPLRRDQGRFDDVARLDQMLQELIALYPLNRSWRAVRAMVLCWLGREDEARHIFDRYAATGVRDIPRDWLFIPTLLFLSTSCAHLGDADNAALLYDALLPYRARFNTEAGSLGASDRMLGCLAATMGQFDRARIHFEDAIELNARIGARPSVAHAQCSYGEMLLRRNPRDDQARNLLASARALFIELGMSFDADRVTSLLDAARCEPLPSPSYPDGLTAREVDVLRLIAAGHSNREIADALVLSVRTVERHITNLYGKIGARGKADATAYAIAHGLTLRR